MNQPNYTTQNNQPQIIHEHPQLKAGDVFLQCEALQMQKNKATLTWNKLLQATDACCCAQTQKLGLPEC